MGYCKPKISIEGQKFAVFSDLCPLTLRKRRELKFLTTKLASLRIAYKWEFPIKLLVDYQRKIVVIKTVQEALDFEV